MVQDFFCAAKKIREIPKGLSEFSYRFDLISLIQTFKYFLSDGKSICLPIYIYIYIYVYICMM